MNNARYNEIGEWGRVQALQRSGLFDELNKEKMKFGLGMVAVRFRRQLVPFQKFTVASFISGWDARSFYIETQLISNHKKATEFVHAVLISRLTLTKGQDISLNPHFFLNKLVGAPGADKEILPVSKMSAALAGLKAMEEASSQCILARKHE